MKLKLRINDNETIRTEMERDVIEAIDSSYVDLGGGDCKFLPIEAAEKVMAICNEILERYDIQEVVMNGSLVNELFRGYLGTG